MGTTFCRTGAAFVPYAGSGLAEVGFLLLCVRYVILMVFLCVCYQFLIEFNKNSYVNLLIILILGVEVLCSSGKLSCRALLIVLVFITKYYNF